MSQNLAIKVSIKIMKPVEEVFQCIIEANKMTKYFISKSSGDLEEGKSIIWHFSEFNVDIPVQVISVISNKFISFSWPANNQSHTVEISLDIFEKESTVVQIIEKESPNNEAGIEWLKGNTEGWANFLACLKAYVEYNINLRKGAFDNRSI